MSSAAAAGLASAFGDFGGMAGSDLQNLLGSMSEQQLQMFLGGLMPVNSPSSNRSASSSTSSSQASRAPSTLPGSRTDPVSTTTAAATAGSAASSSSTSTAKASSTSVAEATPIADKKEENGTLNGTTTNGSKGANGFSSNKIQLSDLQNILGNLKPGDFSERQEVDLADVITLDVMAPILANKSIQEKLTQYLPDSEILPKTEQELRTTLTTPQFKKAMSSFSSALQSGQLGPIMKQFDLPPEVSVAAAQGNLEAFAKAMEQYSQTKKDKKSKEEDGDNKMDC
jgi:ribosomal protein L12E/L44/L45/RPP1/RPP2